MPFTTVLLPAGLPCQGQDPASPPLLPATVALQHGTSAFLRAEYHQLMSRQLT